MLIVVALIVVKQIGFGVIACYPTMRFWRKLEEMLPQASRTFLNQQFRDQTEGKPKFKDQHFRVNPNQVFWHPGDQVFGHPGDQVFWHPGDQGFWHPGDQIFLEMSRNFLEISWNFWSPGCQTPWSPGCQKTWSPGCQKTWSPGCQKTWFGLTWKFWPLNFGFPSVWSRKFWFGKLREACRIHFHLFSSKSIRRIPSYDQKPSEVNEY